jgi:hypothetical protein
MKEKEICHGMKTKNGSLEQVGRIGVLLGSNKVLLDGSRRDKSVEDVDGTGLLCQRSFSKGE